MFFFFVSFFCAHLLHLFLHIFSHSCEYCLTETIISTICDNLRKTVKNFLQEISNCDCHCSTLDFFFFLTNRKTKKNITHLSFRRKQVELWRPAHVTSFWDAALALCININYYSKPFSNSNIRAFLIDC